MSDGWRVIKRHETDDAEKTLVSVEFGYYLGGNDEPEMTAEVKWDGCIHFRRWYPSADGKRNSDYMHLCELSRFINELMALADAVKATWKAAGDTWEGER